MDFPFSSGGQFGGGSVSYVPGGDPLESPPHDNPASHLLPSHLFEIRLSSDIGGRQILRSLRELSDGWFGADSLAPSEIILANVEEALSGVAITARTTTEVDTDGTVSLVWQQGEGSFALTFVGNGQVIGSVFPQSSKHLPWVLPVSEAEEIAARLAERDIAVQIS